MGVVWRARDERLGRTVAVKELRVPVGMSSTQIEQSHLRARREARIAARLQHPHAVAVYDVVDHEGRPCLVMEYVPSNSLAEVLADGTALTSTEVAEIGVQLASALVAAHEAGIVHRDVKPGNILMADGGRAKLTDFGISRATGDVTLTATGEMLGTPTYTSPEVAQGRPAGASSDVFSLGATLYAAVEGTPPFGNGPTAMALLLRIVNDEIRPPEHTGALMDTLLWMLQHEPADRPSMDEVRRSLAAVTAETITVEPLLAVEDAVAESAADAVPAAEAPEPAEQSSRSQSQSTAKAPVATADTPADPDSGSGSSSGSGSASVPAGTASGPTSPWSRRRLLPWALLVLAAMLTAGIVAAITASQGSSGPAAAPQTSHTAQTGRTTASSGAGGGKTAASTTASTPPATRTSASQLTSAISSYYQLVPGHLDQAWGYLTADYQQNHAGGMSGYQQFWGQIQRVSISNLVAESPSTVVVTIDYFYKSGSTVQERTSFGLVQQGGIWKIASSSVLSSNTL
jgi:serine/threonine protein kinase